MLSDALWQLLIAITTEEKVHQSTASKFITAYKLGSSSTVQRSLQALEAKEMIQRVEGENSGYYQVHACFLSRWLA